jgi:hypothetical protein
METAMANTKIETVGTTKEALHDRIRTELYEFFASAAEANGLLLDIITDYALKMKRDVSNDLPCNLSVIILDQVLEEMGGGRIDPWPGLTRANLRLLVRVRTRGLSGVILHAIGELYWGWGDQWATKVEQPLSFTEKLHAAHFRKLLETGKGSKAARDWAAFPGNMSKVTFTVPMEGGTELTGVYWLESYGPWVSNLAPAGIMVYVSIGEGRTRRGPLNGSTPTVVAEAIFRQMMKEAVGQSIADFDEVSVTNLLAELAEI